MPSRTRSLAPDHFVFDEAAFKAASCNRRPTRNRSEIDLQESLETMRAILAGDARRQQLVAALVARSIWRN